MPPNQTTRQPALFPATAILFIGAALRMALLTDNRLHPDEALFGALARLIVTGQDPLLAHTSLLVDKPPLLYYTLAAGITMSWASELTLRVPGLFASIISMALVGRLSWLLWRRQRGAEAAMLFYVLSPFAISFAPTAFADPLMVVWLLGAMAAAASGRWGWGGVLFGLAFACKQNAVFFVPLVVGLGITCAATRDMGRRAWGAAGFRFAAGLAGVVVLLLIWDAARGASVGTWQAAVAANNPQRLIRSSEVLPRLAAWWEYLSVFTGSSISFAVVAAVIGGLAAADWRSAAKDRRTVTSVVMLAFALGYFALLWLVAFPLLDRYLLGIVPVTALLLGRAVDRAEDPLENIAASKAVLFRAAAKGLPIVLIAGALLAPAFRASRSAYAVGGDHGTYDGIDDITAYVRTLPDGTIVYYDSLGWTLAYYLFDAYVVPVSVASPAALQNDLETYGSRPEQRYLLLPGWLSHIQMLDAAAEAGFRPRAVLETVNRFGMRSFSLYRLEAPD